jgi:hypothetical protein
MRRGFLPGSLGSVRVGISLIRPSMASSPTPLTHSESPNRAVVRIIYFIPTDRQPEADFRDRLDRVLTNVQQFYRLGMEQNGYGQITFELDRESDGALRIYEVQGKAPMHDYGRNDYNKVRQEVKTAMTQQGLDIDHETIIIFQLLLEWQNHRAMEIGPYVGCGSPWNGTAWVYDDAKLDAHLLSSCAAGGYYGNPCSLGQFNTHYIGGVAHELGHAFGLPHDCECNDDRPHRRYSLMSRGNHTYGQEQRNEGKGTLLSPASALPLSVHPLFTGNPKPTHGMTCRLMNLHTSDAERMLILTGQAPGTPRVIGLVAHNDPIALPEDYDAVGWVCPVDQQGRFHLTIGDLKPGHYELRLTAYGEDGQSQMFKVPYSVKWNGRPNLRSFSQMACC